MKEEKKEMFLGLHNPNFLSIFRLIIVLLRPLVRGRIFL